MTKLNDLYSYCTKRGGDNFYGAGIKFTFLALAWYGVAAYLRKIAKSCWSTVCTLQNTFCQNIKVATCEENWRCWVSSSWYSVLRGNEAFLRGRSFFCIIFNMFKYQFCPSFFLNLKMWPKHPSFLGKLVITMTIVCLSSCRRGEKLFSFLRELWKNENIVLKKLS